MQGLNNNEGRFVEIRLLYKVTFQDSKPSTAFSVLLTRVNFSSGLFQKLSSGVGGPQTLFCPVGGGCFVDNVFEGWGVEGVTCPGGQGIFEILIHSGAV